MRGQWILVSVARLFGGQVDGRSEMEETSVVVPDLTEFQDLLDPEELLHLSHELRLPKHVSRGQTSRFRCPVTVIGSVSLVPVTGVAV